jgi:mxaK protein
MAMTRKARGSAVALIVVAALGAAAAWEGVRLLEARQWNRTIAGDAAAAPGTGAPPQVLFAQAYHAERRGDIQQALEQYRQVMVAGPEPLRVAAAYNSGNVLLRQGRRAGGDDALTWAELAKEAYRRALRADSGHWDAKYNLERALRLSPEPEDAELAESAPQPPRERAPATVRSFVHGLP